MKSLQSTSWYVCTPISIDAAKTAPSSSNTCFSIDKVSPNENLVVTKLIQTLGNVFYCNGHQY